VTVTCVLHTPETLDQAGRAVFAALLREQGKVRGNTADKVDRCQLLCIVNTDAAPIAIGAIKRKTVADFWLAGLPALEEAFDWELGYLYTQPTHQGQGIAATVVRELLTAYGPGNLMASTEISANPAMVRLLENHRFSRVGRAWKSAIHGNDLGLFLRMNDRP